MYVTSKSLGRTQERPAGAVEALKHTVNVEQVDEGRIVLRGGDGFSYEATMSSFTGAFGDDPNQPIIVIEHGGTRHSPP